jgi:branched-subunit amino acid transport protein AzlD
MCLQDWAYLHKEHGLYTFLAVVQLLFVPINSCTVNTVKRVLLLFMCLQDWAYLHKEHGLSTFLAVRIADAHGRPLGVLCLSSTATCAYQEEWCVACAAAATQPCLVPCLCPDG